LLRPTAFGGWRLPLLLRSAALDGCLLLPPLRLTARGGLQLLRPAALGPWPLLMGCPALHPPLRLLSQLLFLTLFLLMLQLPIAASWSLSGRREAPARDGDGGRRFAAATNSRTWRAIARGRRAGSDSSLPIHVSGGIHFTFSVFAPLRELEDLWFGHRQRH